MNCVSGGEKAVQELRVEARAGPLQDIERISVTERATTS